MKTLSKISAPLLLFLLLLGISISGPAQNGFALPEKQKKDKIQFKLVNNLPVIPVEVNGTKLSFILDTGVKSTILFSLENADSLLLNNATPIQLHGLGEGGSVEALKSLGNEVKVGGAMDRNHALYIIFDKSLNFSPRMGIPIHGILGNDFFKNFIVKISYGNERLTFYKPENYVFKNCKKYEELDLIFEAGKPYIKLDVASQNTVSEVNLLVDSGSSDALWLFDPEGFITESPKNYFEDFLGLGLSGNIFGKRSQLQSVVFGEIKMPNINASFPNVEAIERAKKVKERDGSVGGGFLSRFTVVFDYKNKKMRLQKNRNFKKPFHYNMSGLTLEHDGVEYVRQEKETSRRGSRIADAETQSASVYNIQVNVEYEFNLVPRYIVVEVLEYSPAALAGIEKGDEVIGINGTPSHQFRLYELIEMFSVEEGKKITLEILREGIRLKKKFFLKNML